MSAEDPRQLVQQIRMSQPPQSAEEVKDRLNIIERLVSVIDPSTEYEAAILEALLELNRIMDHLTPGETQNIEGVSILELPDDTVSLLQQANIRLEELVQGTVETQRLPVGLTGISTSEIGNGETGIGLFRFSGGRYAAQVTADEAIDQFDNIRVKEREDNLVTPISAEEEVGEIEAPQNRRQEYSVPVNAGADILSRSVRPRTNGSTLRVTVQLDTTTQFALRVNPDRDGVAAFNSILNETGDLEAGALFEFEFDGDPDARYNFRTPNTGVTVDQIRVQEILVA